MDAIKELFEWSANFDGRYLHEHLGYKEMVMLGEALKTFESNGYEAVYNYCTELEG